MFKNASKWAHTHTHNVQAFGRIPSSSSRMQKGGEGEGKGKGKKRGDPKVPCCRCMAAGVNAGGMLKTERWAFPGDEAAGVKFHPGLLPGSLRARES